MNQTSAEDVLEFSESIFAIKISRATREDEVLIEAIKMRGDLLLQNIKTLFN